MHAFRHTETGRYRRGTGIFDHTHWTLIEDPSEEQLTDKWLEVVPDIDGPSDPRLRGIAVRATDAEIQTVDWRNRTETAEARVVELEQQLETEREAFDVERLALQAQIDALKPAEAAEPAEKTKRGKADGPAAPAVPAVALS